MQCLIGTYSQFPEQFTIVYRLFLESLRMTSGCCVPASDENLTEKMCPNKKNGSQINVKLLLSTDKVKNTKSIINKIFITLIHFANTTFSLSCFIVLN